MIDTQQEVLMKSIERLDDDLAIRVILAKLSSDQLYFARIFSVAAQLMYTRSMEKIDDLTAYEKKIVEMTTYAFAQSLASTKPADIN